MKSIDFLVNTLIEDAYWREQWFIAIQDDNERLKALFNTGSSINSVA